MKGNPTAGILLMILASLLIVLGVTDKGKKILAILLSKDTSITKTPSEIEPEKNPDGTTKKYSGDVEIPASHAKYPGAYVGEKGAGKI